MHLFEGTSYKAQDFTNSLHVWENDQMQQKKQSQSEQQNPLQQVSSSPTLCLKISQKLLPFALSVMAEFTFFGFNQQNILICKWAVSLVSYTSYSAAAGGAQFG